MREQGKHSLACWWPDRKGHTVTSTNAVGSVNVHTKFLVSVMVRSGDTLIIKVKSGGKVTASLKSIGFFVLGA